MSIYIYIDILTYAHVYISMAMSQNPGTRFNSGCCHGWFFRMLIPDGHDRF